MYKITKEFHFCASHTLNNLSAEHPCSRLHGHNYTVIVECSSAKLDDTGMVVDYRKLDPVKRFIDEKFDHRHLNELVEFNTTAENLAKFFYDLFDKTIPHLSAITVKEGVGQSVRYTPEFETKKVIKGKELAERINDNML